MNTKTESAVVESTATAEVTATAPAAAAKTPKATKAEKPAKEKKATATKAEKPAKEKVEKAPKAPSTKSKVLPLVTAAIAAGTARKDTLAKMQTEFGISAACANTYYQNVKSGTWK